MAYMRDASGKRLDAISVVSAGDAVVAPGVLLTSPRGLRRWSAALADAASGAAVISVHGDSISKGVGSDGASGDTSPLSYVTAGWVGQLRSLFAATYGDPGEGNVGIIEGGNRWVFAGGAAATSSVGPHENGGRAAGTAQTITITLPACTQIDLYLWDGGSSTGTYTVDGGAPVTYTAGTGNSAALTWTKLSITGLADTAHTVVIAGPGAGTVYLASSVALRKTTGVQVHRFARSGNTTQNLVGQDASLNGNAAGQTRMLASTAKVPGANLVIISLGVNDFALQNTTSPTLAQPGSTPDQYEANLRAAITQAVANGACVLLLGEPRQNPANYPNPATYSEADYWARAKKIAGDTDHVAFLDVADLWGPHAEGNASGFYTTGSVHPTRKGHRSMAQLVHRALTVFTAPLGAIAAVIADPGVKSSLSSAFRRRDPARTIYLGDSITVLLSVPAQQKYGEVFSSLTSMVLGQRLLFAGNAGVTNDTVQQMAARLQADVVAKAPGRCFVLAGTNNTNQTSPTMAQTMLDYEQGIILPLLSAGIEPIVGTIPPRTGSQTSAPTTYRNTLLWNAFLHRLAQRYSLKLVDFYAALVNPATGDYAAGLSDDGVHPNKVGALVMAQRALADLGPYLAPHGLPLTKDDLSTINLLARGTFSGGMTGSRPAGWTSGFTNGAEGVISIVAKTGALVGSWAQIAKAGTTTVNFNQTITTGFAPGDRIAFLGKYEADTLAGGAYATISATFRNASAAAISSVIPVNQYSQAYSDLTFYDEAVVPADCASIRVDLGTNATGTGNFRFGQMTLLNLTALGLV